MLMYYAFTFIFIFSSLFCSKIWFSIKIDLFVVIVFLLLINTKHSNYIVLLVVLHLKGHKKDRGQ